LLSRIRPLGGLRQTVFNPLTKASAKKLKVTQRKMERSMLGVSLGDHIRNEELRRRTCSKTQMELDRTCGSHARWQVDKTIT